MKIKKGNYYSARPRPRPKDSLVDPVVVVLSVSRIDCKNRRVCFTGKSRIAWDTSYKEFTKDYQPESKLVGLIEVGIVTKTIPFSTDPNSECQRYRAGDV